jgi:PncC family amidohydrolase
MTTDAADLVAALGAEGLTLGTAESLTGGMLASAITAVPGASKVYCGGVVSYATDVKTSLLGVTEDLVSEFGVVSAECAAAMAVGVRRLLGVDIAVSTTGVAGPDEQEGRPVGTAFVGVASAEGTRTIALTLSGNRAAIQQQVVLAALSAITPRPGMG